MHYAFQFRDIWAARGEFAMGALLTLELSVAATLISLLIAILGAAGRIYGPLWLRVVVSAYVEIIRNTPFLVQVFFLYFGLPLLGVRIDATTTALSAMVLNGTAYTIEIVRAGIESIGRGQIEASRALGLSPVQTFRDVILPQALKATLPPLESQFIILMLASSVASAISVNELTGVANLVSSDTYRSFEVYITAAGIYLALSLLFSGGFAIVNQLLFGRMNPR